jgi:hypothetical protein
MEIGSPRTHEGASHAAKHYLAPAELWEDVAQEVEPDSRPVALLKAHFIGELPFTGDGLTATGVKAFNALERAYVKGYLTVISRSIETGIEAARFRDDNPNRSIHHLGDGVIVELNHRADGLHMRTAYRPIRASLSTTAAYERLPRGLDALSRRLTMARNAAQRILARRLEEDSP